MQIRITRIISKVGIFNKSIKLEETLFLYSDIHEDELFPLIKAIGDTVTDGPSDPGQENIHDKEIELIKSLKD